MKAKRFEVKTKKIDATVEVETKKDRFTATIVRGSDAGRKISIMRGPYGACAEVAVNALFGYSVTDAIRDEASRG
jgi:hypothetical protein